MPLGEAAALLNAVVWAATGVIAKTLSSAVRPIHVVTAHTLFASAIFLVVTVISGGVGNLIHAQPAALLFFGAAALFNTVGAFLFFTAISRDSVGGTYTTTTGLYIVLSLMAGVLVFHESVGLLAVLGAAGIVAGVYILNGPGRIKQGKNAADQKPEPAGGMAGVGSLHSGVAVFHSARLFAGLGLGAATAVLWTFGLIAMKWGLERSDVITGAFMRNVVAASVYLAFAFMSRSVAFPKAGASDWVRLLLSAAVFAVSAFSWNYALAHADAGITAVLASTSPIFAVAMAIIFLKERLGRIAIAGAVIAAAGTLLVVAGG
ncbi:MAG: DMT family transporter [Dehalococcoidia bacterium]|nr:DMT family transporter [Dehalococcoidia bacterium]